MRVLVVQNYDDTGPGQVGTALADVGAELDIVTAQRGSDLPADASRHDALLVLGGAQHALDDGHSPYFPALLSLIRAFAEADRSVLGICLGSQLIARAFGGENRLGVAEEFGWQPVRLAPAAAEDPLFAGLPAEFPIFQWHDDTFSLPPGALPPGIERGGREPGLPHRPRRLRHSVPLRGRPAAGPRLERCLRRDDRQAPTRLGRPPRCRSGALRPDR